jgi:hypothetical protein
MLCDDGSQQWVDHVVIVVLGLLLLVVVEVWSLYAVGEKK